MTTTKQLSDYFLTHWVHSPYPIIDHALRVNRRPNGSFEFYIHPMNENGTTCDFIAECDATVKERKEINGVLE
jgi:hypothetical protein